MSRSVSLVSHKEGGFALLSLFRVVSGSFQPVVACHGLFWVIPLSKSDRFTENFDLNFYYKSTSRFTNSGSFNVFQRRASVIAKWGSFFVHVAKRRKYCKIGQVLQGGTIFIAKWGKYYKAGQPLLQSGSNITKQDTTSVSMVIHHTDGLKIAPNYLFCHRFSNAKYTP